MRVLLHACCGPCSIYPVDALRGEGAELMLYFHNPNVHPYQEYLRRVEALKKAAGAREVKLIVDDEYDVERWVREMAFREVQRCRLCYARRLQAVARAAKRGRFDAFTTTLLYSQHQKHELIRELAEAVAEETGVPFLYRDFRQGWKAGIAASQELGLYRQEYCGCLFSEHERFRSVRPAPLLPDEGEER